METPPQYNLTGFTSLCDAICSRDDSPEYSRLLVAIRNRDALDAGACLIVLAENYLQQGKG